jgi:hypothetical protein
MLAMLISAAAAPPTPSDNDESTRKVLQTHVALLTARVTGLQSDKKVAKPIHRGHG